MELDHANIPRLFPNGAPMTLKDRCEYLIEFYNRGILSKRSDRNV